MRIIGGQFKGRTLVCAKGDGVRPTTDRTKEAIFNLVQSHVEDAAVLDLFAGSGALGIEALSRGAARVVLCDNQRESVEIINQNLKKVQGDVEVVQKDFRSALLTLSNRGEQFSLVFLDPPYGVGHETTALRLLDEYQLLANGGLVVLESRRDEKEMPYTLPEGLALLDERDYGATRITLLTKGTKACLTGTFDPFTLGHQFLAEQALADFDFLHVAVLHNPDKTPTFSQDLRVKWIEKALLAHKKRVFVHTDSGLAIDYCKRYGIKTIIRGARNEDDLAYETEMASWNKEHGNVDTLIIPAVEATLSSSLVKETLLQNGDLTHLVPKVNIKAMQSEAKKW